MINAIMLWLSLNFALPLVPDQPTIRHVAPGRIAAIHYGVPQTKSMFVEGSNRFFNRGVNGRWRGVLEPGDLAAYNTKVQAKLSPTLAAWLEGRPRVDARSSRNARLKLSCLQFNGLKGGGDSMRRSHPPTA